MPDDILNNIVDSDENELRDDDHLDKPELTDKEADQGFKDLIDKYKDQDPVKEPNQNKFTDGVINALNKIT